MIQLLQQSRTDIILTINAMEYKGIAVVHLSFLKTSYLVKEGFPRMITTSNEDSCTAGAHPCPLAYALLSLEGKAASYTLFLLFHPLISEAGMKNKTLDQVK